MSLALSVRPALRTALIITLLFAGTVLLFSRAAHQGFVGYDDPGYVTANPQVQAGLAWSSLVWAFTGATDYWHPLTWLAHMLDWQLFGADAFGHHLSGILWHALNAVLVFALFRRFGAATWLAAASAALFAWHPLRVESVAWITERKDVMSGAFFLFTLLAYLRYARRRVAAQPILGAYLLTLLGFAAGLMSKPMLVTLPLVLLLLDFWPLHRLATPRNLLPLLVEKIPFCTLSAAVAALTIVMQQHEGAFILDLPWTARAGNALVSLARYLGKFLWPADLSVCYPHPGHWPAFTVLAASLFALAVTWLCWRLRRSRPWLLVGWLWFLIVLLPALGLLQVGFQAMADRYTYLALLGIQIALCWSVAPWLNSPRLRLTAGAIAVALLVGCGVRSWDQQRHWRDTIALFAHAVTVAPDNAVAHSYLAHSLLEQNRLDEAAQHIERANLLSPHNGPTLFTLGCVRERQGRLDEAIALHRESIAVGPANALAHQHLGLLELNAGRADEARRQLLTALRLDASLQGNLLQIGQAFLQRQQPDAAGFVADALIAVFPDQAAPHYLAALAATAQGRPDEAISHHRAVLRLQPDAVATQYALGVLLLPHGDATAAVEPIRAAATRWPKRADVQLSLAQAEAALDHPDASHRALAQAIAAAPENPDILAAAAELAARRRDFATAADCYRRLTRLTPDNASAHAALGYMLTLTGDRAGATAAWEQALRLQPDFPHLRERIEALRRNP